MAVVAQNIRCSHCGAPVEFKPGELIATCKYCAFTTVIETGQAFKFEHSVLINKYTPEQIEGLVRDWMRSGFMKPSDLAKKSKITEKNLVYLPFWVITVEATTKYKGIFERISPPIVKEGQIQREYNWLVLAETQPVFPHGSMMCLWRVRLRMISAKLRALPSSSTARWNVTKPWSWRGNRLMDITVFYFSRI